MTLLLIVAPMPPSFTFTPPPPLTQNHDCSSAIAPTVWLSSYASPCLTRPFRTWAWFTQVKEREKTYFFDGFNNINNLSTTSSPPPHQRHGTPATVTHQDYLHGTCTFDLSDSTFFLVLPVYLKKKENMYRLRLAVTLATLAANVISGHAQTITCQNPTPFICISNHYLPEPYVFSAAIDVSCGKGACAARQNDGTAVVWGDANYGGDASSVDLTNVADISCGGTACVARKNDGTAVAWGLASRGGWQNGSCAEPFPLCTTAECW